MVKSKDVFLLRILKQGLIIVTSVLHNAENTQITTTITRVAVTLKVLHSRSGVSSFQAIRKMHSTLFTVES